MGQDLELIARSGQGGRTELRSPAVGAFTHALPEGALLSPGAFAGRIVTLGVARDLRVPAGATGRIVSPRPVQTHTPVGFGTVLYEIVPLAGEAASDIPDAPAIPAQSADGLFVRAPLSGRFWHRAAPSEPPLVSTGSLVEAGQPVGLIEVMKTFSHIRYEPDARLPMRARVVRLVADDGAEVAEGAPLIEVESG